VGASTVKRYAAAAREGRSLAPKKRPGSKPKLDAAATKLAYLDTHASHSKAAYLSFVPETLPWRLCSNAT
jgi:transposase